jgi:6,7-dimethyl-8-ribityllumazine synthase
MTSSKSTDLDPVEAARLGERAGRVLWGVLSGATRVGLACSRFNGAITTRLLSGALSALEDHGVPQAGITLVWVPGAFELPLAARALATEAESEAVVCLGAVIRGETAHFEYVAGQCAAGLAQVSLDTGVPIAFGVLTTEDVDQALSRSGDGPSNKGYEAALGALEMAGLLRGLSDSRGRPERC